MKNNGWLFALVFLSGLATSSTSSCADVANATTCASWKASGYCVPGYSYQSLTINGHWCPNTCGQCAMPCAADVTPYCASWGTEYCDEKYTYLGQSVRNYWCQTTCFSCAASPPPAGGNVTSDAPPPFANLLIQHNTYRARHKSTGRLYWSPLLADHAAAVATQCLLRHTGSNMLWGENLFWTTGKVSNPMLATDAATDMWYAEIAAYNYSNPGPQVGVGHFTQVVWRSTTAVGCAVQNCKDSTYVVCHYLPMGNMVGDYAANVMPLI